MSVSVAGWSPLSLEKMPIERNARRAESSSGLLGGIPEETNQSDAQLKVVDQKKTWEHASKSRQGKH